jgi:[ribosomal protein S18]-alanine N-acetyltransferase
MVFTLEPMKLEDVGEVSRVERRCFSNPWPSSAYRRELKNLEQNYYIVLRGPDLQQTIQPRGRFVEEYADNWRGLKSLGLLSLARRNHGSETVSRIAGFAGMWQLFDEAHITTIGVDPPYRGRGFGELMLVALIDEATRRGANVMTLEVRVTNEPAIALYRKYEFTIHGVRPHYYSDNAEDAYVMWSPSLRDDGYQRRIEPLRQALSERLNGVIGLSSRPQTPAARHASNGADKQ